MSALTSRTGERGERVHDLEFPSGLTGLVGLPRRESTQGRSCRTGATCFACRTGRPMPHRRFLCVPRWNAPAREGCLRRRSRANPAITCLFSVQSAPSRAWHSQAEVIFAFFIFRTVAPRCEFLPTQATRSRRCCGHVNRTAVKRRMAWELDETHRYRDAIVPRPEPCARGVGPR